MEESHKKVMKRVPIELLLQDVNVFKVVVTQQEPLGTIKPHIQEPTVYLRETKKDVDIFF